MKFIDILYLLLSYTNADNVKTKQPHFKAVALLNCVGVFIYFLIPSFLAKAIYTLILLAVEFFFKETRGIIFSFIPIIIWVLLFSSAKDIPMDWRRPIDVDTLYNLENKLGLISFYFYKNENVFLDLLAWLPYGIVHYIMPVIVGIYLLLYYKPGFTSAYLFFFGTMNTLGVITQLCWPTAPPWYYKKYDTTPATYEMHGDPAGLQRIDDLFHINFYTTTFTGNPLPWGAWPSLHSGFAVYSALFLSYIYPKYCPLFFMYVAWIWWATMYLGHHYFVDLLGGFVYAGVCFLGAIVYLKIKKPYHKDYNELRAIMVYQSKCEHEVFEIISHKNNNTKLGTYLSDSVNKINNNNNNDNDNDNDNDPDNDDNNKITIITESNTKVEDGNSLISDTNVDNEINKRGSMTTQFHNNGPDLDKLGKISTINQTCLTDPPSSVTDIDITDAKII
ncbi:PAP2-domain-containing protein [Anaeromyces robustus]|jgi:membrane-associated phospholipid phosphatase|uniref:PAP2-domain-containing protein n=1 Tax=Anaeromyces robustus TaxID=1754192 RepID=A0A1Y1X0C7_9FUNG|nr:PAP2-domain-containing protein [Anaeromyces robustus]|eukprot:ORX79193.1 PAP2-domain-containing protein [Anaeromyces robustus]